MQRRNFIGNLAKGAGTLIIVPTIFTACEKDPIEDPNDNNGNGNGDDNLLTVDLSETQNSALLSAGGFVIRNNVIIINSGGTYIALSSVCTHQGCQITYNPSAGNLPCNCHGSLFNLSGSVLNGPADAPLATYPVTENGDVLEIDLG
jgi:cytochrome b6-f complex iron-sulfur subunit